MSGRVHRLAVGIARELRLVRRVLSDPRTPWAARVFLGSGVAYALSPIDIIPDFIPVIGHLDDAVIVPALLAIGYALIPGDVVREHRETLERERAEGAAPNPPPGGPAGPGAAGARRPGG